jgi:hypothetical protein
MLALKVPEEWPPIVQCKDRPNVRHHGATLAARSHHRTYVI